MCYETAKGPVVLSGIRILPRIFYYRGGVCVLHLTDLSQANSLPVETAEFWVLVTKQLNFYHILIVILSENADYTSAS